VRTGPYKYIRHPRYLGIIIFFTGISFIFRSYLAMGTVVMLLMVLAWRIFAEESLMKQKFEKEWDNYCATSWRIIPYLF
jgi:protein-S-isoprenylcysteine O-methyltransferase Ste14